MLNLKMDAETKSLSNCALQIALQTMKDRCQQLQHRLSDLEEENLKLRISKTKQELPHEKEDQVDRLQRELETLSQQKSQLTHHIFMVATENKQLWTKLSVLTEEKIAPEQSLHLVKDCSKSDNLKEVDISIANNLDMLDVCKSDVTESPSMKDLEFNLSLMSVNGDESNNFEMNELQEQLNQTKVRLKSVLSQFKNQQQLMRTVVKELVQKKIDKDNAPPPLCSNCQESRKHLRDKTYKVSKSAANTPPEPHDSITPETESPLRENDDSSLMVSAQFCPICENMESGQSEFLEHVYSHFGESYEEEESATVHPGSNTLEHGSVFPQFNI